MRTSLLVASADAAMARADVAVAAGSAPDSTFRTAQRAGVVLAGTGGRGMATNAKEANLLQ
jgi:hypothetical protein